MQRRFENELKRYFENEPDGRRRILRRGFEHHKRKKTNYKRIFGEKSANEFKKKKNPLNTQNRSVNIEIGIQFKWNKHYKDGSNCKKRA